MFSIIKQAVNNFMESIEAKAEEVKDVPKEDM